MSKFTVLCGKTFSSSNVRSNFCYQWVLTPFFLYFQNEKKDISVEMNSITFLLTCLTKMLYYNAKISFFIWERQGSARFNKEKFTWMELTNGLFMKQHYLVKAASTFLCEMCTHSELPAHSSFKKEVNMSEWMGVIWHLLGNLHLFAPVC